VPADQSKRSAIIHGLEALERRFREEQDRNAAALAEMQNELHELAKRGADLGISVTAMSKAMKVSRGRLKRMIESLR
jgi:hypothetical protein